MAFYHYRKYEKKYAKISVMLNLLSNKTLKNAKEVLSTVEDLISIGLDLPRVNIQNLTDHMDGLKYGELEDFAYKLLPRIASMALEAEALFPEEDKYQILEMGIAREVTLSRLQLMCLLSLSFFGLVPLDISDDLPSNRFICGLFYKSSTGNQAKTCKLPFVFSYFKESIAGLQASDESLIANVTFSRRKYAPDLRNTVDHWQSIAEPMAEVEIDTFQKIEDYEGTQSIKVDFSNKMIGGSVLHKGAVQEEIFFLAYFECLASLLFVETFCDHESLWIMGAIKSNDYEGYSKSLKFVGPSRVKKELKTDLDSKERMKTVICAIDAIKFTTEDADSQFRVDKVIRELVKACSGFQKTGDATDEWKVVTGKWGCGAFNGDKVLKFVIQWLACSVTGRTMVFTTLMDDDLKYIGRVVRKLKQKKTNEVFSTLVTYCKTKVKLPDYDQTLFDVFTQD